MKWLVGLLQQALLILCPASSANRMQVLPTMKIFSQQICLSFRQEVNLDARPELSRYNTGVHRPVDLGAGR
jgi:hypothetical protein